MTPFGRYLMTLRINRRIKQKDLGEAIGVNPSYVSAIESGKKPPPARHTIKAMVTALDLNKKEASLLWDYADQSIRLLRIPDDLPEEQYAMLKDIRDALGSSLSRGKVSIIRSILALDASETREMESR